MSKIKKAAAPKAVTSGAMFAHLKKGIEQKAKAAIENKTGKIIALAVLGLLLFVPFMAVKGSMAMLYLIADNGKKSGRADGNVYMRNGRVRGFKVPALVRNPATSIARTNLASFSSAWSDLTNEQRLSFINADNVFASDRFGRQVAVKGKALFVMANTNLANVGIAPIDTWPDQAAPVALTSLVGAADVSSTSFDLTFTPTPVAANTALLVFATAQKRQSIYRPSQSEYRMIAAFPATTASPADIYALYIAKFGALVADKRVFVRVFVINTVSGQASAATDTSTIVTA